MDVLAVVLALLVALTGYCRASYNYAGYTFLSPGRSYIEFKPRWSLSQPVGIQFSFRTLKSNAFLMHHTFVNVDYGLHKPQIWIQLRKGELQATHEYGDDIQSLTLAKGLSHDKWHKVSMVLDANKATLTVTVDKRATKTITITAFSKGDASKAIEFKKQTSIVSIGGFNPESLQEPVDFVGCIRQINFYEAKRLLTVPLDEKHGVSRGCSNHCERDDPCIHNGRCINHYTHTTCDCFSTGYEGKHCEREGMTTLTLLGKEWVSYSVRTDEETSTHTPSTRVALDFKTRAPAGILFYARELYQHRNHLAVSLHNGSLYVSVYFVDQISQNELFVSLGSGLDDDRWHRVNVSHQGKGVDVSVDFETVKMTADHTHPHLRMPRTLFYGGMDVSSEITGLKTTKNFVGCIRGMYFNHVSILEELNSTRSTYHHGQPQYGCQDVTRTAIQFTAHGEFIKVEHHPSDSFTLQMDFRSLKKECVLAYTVTSSGVDRGHIKITLVNGKVDLVVVPDRYQPNVKLALSQGEYLNDNEWHTLSISFKNRLAQMVVDGVVVERETSWNFINFENSTYVGSGPDTDISASYIGCMKNVAVQSVEIDPVETFHSQLGVGITLGSCDLVDWCRRAGSPCQNGGRCVSVWNDTHCDCRGTSYGGKYCQFARLRRTCDEYYQAGETRTGVWEIDIDGPGPSPPKHVFCHMGAELDGRSYGLTRIDNNLKAGSTVREAGMTDIKKVISYREMNTRDLQKMVGLSEKCRQNITMSCNEARLWMGYHTWMTSARGKKFSTLGGRIDQACDCHEKGTCSDARFTCNCDKRLDTWVVDGGYVYDKDNLPVTEMSFLQRGGTAKVSLGPLECFGSYTQEDNLAMFTTSQSSLSLPGWRRGDLEFVFRTTEQDAVLLYQPGRDPYSSEYQLFVMLRGGRFLQLHISHAGIVDTLQLNSRLNTGTLQHISLEFAQRQARLQVNGEDFYYDIETGRFGPGDEATVLHIGATVSMMNPGMIGCLGGLRYNGAVAHLASYITESSANVSEGCTTTCDSNPCQFGSECVEHWTHYSCECTNKYSQLGNECQQDINEDLVTFLSGISYLFYHRVMELDLLARDLVFSFRTSQRAALLLYASDHLNNFIHVQLEESNTLAVIYNSNSKIHKKEITVTGLNDGTWKQVAIMTNPVCSYALVRGDQLENIGRPAVKLSEMDIDTLDKIPHPEILEGWYALTQPCFTKIVVSSLDVTLNSVKRNLLTDYSPKPYANQTEYVHPLREVHSGVPGMTVYVGGVPSSMADAPGLVGCFRGLRMGDSIFPLGDSAATGIDMEGVYAGCNSGCSSAPCANKGRCVDDREVPAHYSCDCSHTSHVGPYCKNKEFELFFDGQSWLVEKLKNLDMSNRLRRSLETGGQTGYEMMLSFNFTAEPEQLFNLTTLAYVGDNLGISDQLLLYLGQTGQVVAEMAIAGENIHVENTVHSAFGKPHRVTVTRNHKHFTLKVDDIETNVIFISDYQMAPPPVLMLGGVKKPNRRHASYGNYTGKISNVFLVSDQLSPANARPVEVFYGHLDGNYGLETSGNLKMTSQQQEDPDSGSQYRPGAQKGQGDGETPQFPPWNVADAQTVTLVDATVPGKPDHEDGKAGAPPALAFVVGFAVLAIFIIIIAVIVIKSRRRKSFTPPQEVPKDEEEGLLQLNPQDEPAPAPEQGFAVPVKNRREAPKNKKKTGSDNGPSDDEGEETPMLQNMEPNDTSSATGETIELANFQQMIDNLSGDYEDPMIDAMDMSDDDMYPVTLRSPQKETYQPMYRRNSSDLEWDPQMDTATPMLPPNEDADEPALLRSSEDRGRTPQGDGGMASPTEGVGDSYYETPREVWTESQVLGAMDIIEEESAEESEPSWDHSGDTSASFHGEETSPLSTATSTPDPLDTDTITLPGQLPPVHGDAETPMDPATPDSVPELQEPGLPPDNGPQEPEEHSSPEAPPPGDPYSVEEAPALRRMQDFDSEPELDTEPVEIQVTADVHRSRGNSESQSRSTPDLNHNQHGHHRNGETAPDHAAIYNGVTTDDNDANSGKRVVSKALDCGNNVTNVNGNNYQSLDDPTITTTNHSGNSNQNNNIARTSAHSREVNEGAAAETPILMTVANPNFGFKSPMSDSSDT